MSDTMDKIKNSAKLRQLSDKDKTKCDNQSCDKQNIGVEYEMTDNDPTKPFVMKVNGKVAQSWPNFDAFNEDRRALVKEFKDKIRKKDIIDKKVCKLDDNEVFHFPTLSECLDFLNDDPFKQLYLDDFNRFIDYGFAPWKALDAVDLFPAKWLKQYNKAALLDKKDEDKTPSRIFQPRFPQWPMSMMERFDRMEKNLSMLMDNYINSAKNDKDAVVEHKNLYYKSYETNGHKVVVQGDDENGYTVKDGDTVLKKFTPEEFKDKREHIDWFIRGYLALENKAKEKNG